MQATERDVLIEQLDELLTGGICDADDALELATVAGLAERLGAAPDALQPAEAWRDRVGSDLLDEAFRTTAIGPYVAAIDALVGASDIEVEDTLSDFDDLVAAAAWCGRAHALRTHAAKVAAIIRQVPDPFAFLAPTAGQMLACPIVAGDLALYDYWTAIHEAEVWNTP